MKKSDRGSANLDEIAKKRFGYEDWRPGQKEAIQSILDGRDTLAVMPTGSGKSAIYQMTAFLIPGATVVVSPLVALQRDQVQSLAEQSVGEAAVVNSSIREADRQTAFKQLEEGDLEFLFLAPEQFSNPETFDRLQAAKPSLFVVDEAHCVSAWGHDFRPDYLRLGQVIAALGHPRILALTATASPLVQTEIVERLGMQDAAILVEGFDRPNIWLDVARFEIEEEKHAQLIQQVCQAEKPGIVYAATRKRTEALAEQFEQAGVRSMAYHAGLKTRDRRRIETAFMQDDIDVLVATTAFGMGVDKPNIRFVFHANISDSLDSYYQEIGRSGRDGEPARAVLFYQPADLNLKRFFAASGKVKAAEVKQVLSSVRRAKTPIPAKELQEQLDLSKSKLRRALNQLVEVGALDALPTGEVMMPKTKGDREQILAAIEQAQERRREFDRSRLAMMQGYAELQDCRRKFLLNYFGESFESPCGACDNCKAGLVKQDTTHQPFALNSRVVHEAWGEGTVLRYEEDKVVVLFEQVGYKTLDVQTTLLRGLLRRA